MKKKINLGNRLILDKQTIAQLDEQQLQGVIGGAAAGTFSCKAAQEAAENQDDDARQGLESCCNSSCNGPGQPAC
ncbi:class I lanthipeptide [Spirosoma koreense]